MAEVEEASDLLAEVREFIDQKWKHSACELCGTDRWMIYPQPTSYVYLSIADERGPLPRPFAQTIVAFLPVSCINCGNLRLVDARIFEKWRRERKPGTSESSS